MSQTMSSTLMKKVLMTCCVLAFVSCTAESTLNSLVEQFPKRSIELNELKDLMLLLSDSTNNFRFLSGGTSGEKSDLVDFFEKGSPIPLSKAGEGPFKAYRNELLKVQTIIHNVGIQYVSVDKQKRAVWITIRGGGVLASDQGYLYTGKSEIASFQLKRFLPIPNHEHWYAFD